jgi:AbrB family looped-hinge helix DNA binding protein
MGAPDQDAGRAHTAIRAKGQVTLPQSVRRALQLDEGDDLLVTVEDGRVVLTPAALIPRDQQWFWTEQWQSGEREASADYAAGRTRRYDDGEQFLADLEHGADSSRSR